MERKPFEMYGLEAYLGDYVDDFDVEAIVDEATEIDYRTGNRYWRDDIDLAAICAKHDGAGMVRDYDGKQVSFEAVVPYMDREIAEELHAEGVEDRQEFFERYAEAHAEKFDGEEFAPYYGGAW